VTFISTVLVVLVTLFEIVFQATNSSNMDSNTDDDKVSRETEMIITVVRIDDEVTNPIRKETETITTTTAAVRIDDGVASDRISAAKVTVEVLSIYNCHLIIVTIY